MDKLTTHFSCESSRLTPSMAVFHILFLISCVGLIRQYVFEHKQITSKGPRLHKLSYNIKLTGINPYAFAAHFVPNFSKESILSF